MCAGIWQVFLNQTSRAAQGQTSRKMAKSVCAITDKPCEEAKDEILEDVRAKRMQDAVKKKEVVPPPRNKVRDEAEKVKQGTAYKRFSKCQSWRSAGSCRSTTATSSSQACSKSAGRGIMRILCVERNSADTDVDPERRRGRHGKAQSSTPSSLSLSLHLPLLPFSSLRQKQRC